MKKSNTKNMKSKEGQISLQVVYWIGAVLLLVVMIFVYLSLKSKIMS